MKQYFNGWMWTILIVVAVLCGTLLWVNAHPYAIRFEMDDNTLEAFKSINYSAILQEKESSRICTMIFSDGNRVPCPNVTMVD